MGRQLENMNTQDSATATPKQVSAKTYFVITFDAKSPLGPNVLENWLKQNHAIEVHTGCLLLYDEITLAEAHQKVFALLGKPHGIKVFPVATTFLYGEDETFDNKLKCIRGDVKT